MDERQRKVQHGAMKLACMQFAAGGSAGFVEICIMHPLDLIKTRLQIQSQQSAGAYKSMLDCVKTTYRSEGALSFYKGVLPPILAETPKRATKFLTFEQYNKLCRVHLRLSEPVAVSLAGLGAGLTEALIINPFEVVKVRQQAERGKYEKQRSAFSLAHQIIKENGFGTRGLNKALTATLLRNGIFNMCYFGFYHNAKALLATNQDTLSMPKRLLIGFLAGSLASTVNIPVDVAKSRIQGPQPSFGVKYKGCFQTIRLVYTEEGIRALFRGLVPKIMRLGPGGAIMLVVYERVFQLLKDTL